MSSASRAVRRRRQEPKAAAGTRLTARRTAGVTASREMTSRLRMPSMPWRMPQTAVMALLLRAVSTTPRRLLLMTWVQPPDWPTMSLPVSVFTGRYPACGCA